MDITEMISGIFSYQTMKCRGLIGTYSECQLKIRLGKFDKGDVIDEILVNYRMGIMEFCSLNSGRMLLDTFQVDLFVHDDSPDLITQEIESEEDRIGDNMPLPADLALAMLENIKPRSGLPDLSGTFGTYIDFNREQDAQQKK